MKKALSFIIALALVISLVPTVAFATGGEEKTEQQPLTLDFTKATYSGTSAKWIIEEDAGWEVDPDHATAVGALGTNTYAVQTLYDTGVFVIRLANSSSGTSPWWSLAASKRNNTVVLKNLLIVNTTKEISAGRYKVKVCGGKTSNGGRAFLYVNEQFAGTFDSYDPDFTGKPGMREDEVVLNTLDLTPQIDENGNSYVSVKLTSAEPEEAGTRRNVAISSITLEPVLSADAATPDKIVIEAPESAEIGEPATVSAYVLMKDGSKKYFSGVKKTTNTSYPYCAATDSDNFIDISVSENAVFAPDFYGGTSTIPKGVFTNEDGTATGTVTVNTEGTTTVTVTATINGVALSPATATIYTGSTDDSVAAQENVSYIVRGSETAFNAGIDMTGYTAGNVGSHPINTSFTAVAKPSITVGDETYNFAYWQTAGGAPIEDAGESYTFTPKSNFTLEAVYVPAEPTDADKKVQFWNYNRVFLGEETVTDGKVSAMPTQPTLAGHIFTGWAAENIGAFDSSTEITAALTRVVAQFTADANKYSVKVDGVQEGTYAYGAPFSKTADATKETQVFSHWVIGDKVVSYDRTISFCVWNNVELTAVYADTAPTAVPTVVLDNIGDEYFILYEVPTGYTAIDAGIVFGTAGTTPRVDSTDGSKASATKLTGQFTAAPGDSTHTAARGYVMYKVNTTGEIRVIYSK